MTLARCSLLVAALASMLACGSPLTPPGGSGGGDGSAGGSGSGGGSIGSGSGSGGGSSGSGGGSSAGGGGGGSGTIDHPEYTSGSRLRARLYSGSDGSKQFLGWQDTQLNLACTFTQVSDGSTRCMPADLGAIVEGYSSDSSCVHLLAIAPAGCATPTYAEQYGDGVACYGTSTTVGIFPVTGQWTGSLWYTSASTGCIATTLPASYTFWSVGAEVNYGNYVEASVTVE